MNKQLFLLLFSFFTASCLSATNVSGPVISNTIWTVANSPYVVTGNILVMENVTLTIEPGVEVRFDASKVIQVNGTLVARGTAADSIRFTSNTTQTPGAWGNIYFTNSSIDAVIDNAGNYVSGCMMEYCIVEYGGKIEGSDADMLRLEEALPGIRNCAIKNALNAGIEVSYTNYDSLNYSLDNNYFRQCKKGIKVGSYSHWISITNSSFIKNECGIYGSGYLMIDNNLFSQNAGALDLPDFPKVITNNEFIDNNPGSGLQNYVITLGGEIHFSNNLCQHNRSNLFLIALQANCNIKSNIFSDNISETGGYLLKIIGGILSVFTDSLNIANNIITNNGLLKPISLSVANMDTYLSSNVISNNYFPGELLSVVNSSYSEDTAAISLTDNIITQNLSTSDFLTSFSGNVELNNNSMYNNYATYVLKNNNSPTFQPYLDVSNNYWGVATTEELNAVIYDFFDDANLGITMFDSILLAPSASNPVLPPANVKKTDMGNNSLQLSWLPNPEADIKGYNVYWGNYSGYTFEHMADAGLNTSYIVENASMNDTVAVTAYDNDYVPGKKSTNWLNENMLNGHESAYSYELHFPLGINEIEKPAEFTLFPVPANEKIVIELNNLNDYNLLSIIDMQGKILKTKQLTTIQTEVNIEDFATGMYFVKLSGAKGMAMKKIIKM